MVKGRNKEKKSLQFKSVNWSPDIFKKKIEVKPDRVKNPFLRFKNNSSKDSNE